MTAIKDYLLAGSPAHYLVLLGALYALVEYILPRTDSVKARSVLELVANLLGRFVPGVSKLGTPTSEPAKPLPLPPAAVLVPFLFFFGCAYCNQVEHKDEPKCKIVNGLVDCSSQVVADAGAAAMTDVVAAISGSVIDWIALAKLEAQYGIGIIKCLVMKADLMAMTPPPDGLTASPLQLKAHANKGAIHAHAAEYAAARK